MLQRQLDLFEASSILSVLNIKHKSSSHKGQSLANKKKLHARAPKLEAETDIFLFSPSLPVSLSLFTDHAPLQLKTRLLLLMAMPSRCFRVHIFCPQTTGRVIMWPSCAWPCWSFWVGQSLPPSLLLLFHFPEATDAGQWGHMTRGYG